MTRPLDQTHQRALRITNDIFGLENRKRFFPDTAPPDDPLTLLDSEEYSLFFINECYRRFLGRHPFSDEPKHHLATCLLSDFQTRINFALSTECYDNFGSNSRMYLSVLWRMIAGNIPLTDIDDLVNSFGMDLTDRTRLVRDLFLRDEVVTRTTARMWTRFTGSLERPPLEIEREAALGDQRALMRAIILHPEYTKDLETADQGLALAAMNLSRSVRRRVYGELPDEKDSLADQETLLARRSVAGVRGWLDALLNATPALSRLFEALRRTGVGQPPDAWHRFQSRPHYYALDDDDALVAPATPRLVPDLPLHRARQIVESLAAVFDIDLGSSQQWEERLVAVGDIPSFSAEMLYSFCGAEAFVEACESSHLSLEDPPGFCFAPDSRADTNGCTQRKIGSPTVSTTYFYWYDRIGGQRLIENPDDARGYFGIDALTHRPPSREFFTSSNQGMHEREFQDMASAGVNVVLPVYFGTPYSAECHFRSPEEEIASTHVGTFSDKFLPKLINARERLIRSGIDAPAIGLFFDTTSLLLNAKNWHVVGNTSVGKAWFYETWRNYFSQIPRRHWASIDGRPLIFIYHQSNFRNPVSDIFESAVDRFFEDFGVRPYVVAAAEQDSVRVCNPESINPWFDLVATHRSFEVLASFLASDEASIVFRGSSRRCTQPRPLSMSVWPGTEKDFSNEFSSCCCLYDKILGRAPRSDEVKAFIEGASREGRFKHVYDFLRTPEAIRGLMAYMVKVCLRVPVSFGELTQHPIVIEAANTCVRTGDPIDGYIDVFSSAEFYEAAGGRDPYFLDYFYRHTTHLIAPRGSRDSDLSELQSIGRRGFVTRMLRSEPVLKGIVSHWLWYDLGRGYAGRGDSDFYWTGAIDPMYYGVASIGPGYDQSAIRSRPLRIAARDDGRRYHAMWQNLLAMEPRPWLVHLETWNEFFEGTEICESREYGRQYIDLTRFYTERFHGLVAWSRDDITEPDIHDLSRPIINAAREEAPVAGRLPPADPCPVVTQRPTDESAETYPHSMIAYGRVYEPEVFRSYFEHDRALLEKYAVSNLAARDGCFVDFLGRVTKCHFLPSIRHLTGKASSQIPVPGDGFYAETIEYIALLSAFEACKGDRFAAAEFGGGWGPWVAAAGVIARRLGISDIQLIGVEANAGKIEFMKEHLCDNGLRPPTHEGNTLWENVDCRCVLGAVWTKDGEVQFPDVDPANEYGASVITDANTTHFRGTPVAVTTVPAYTMETLLGRLAIVDFIHIDIQGAEATICEHSIEFLKKHVRFVFVATHSREIEGRLIILFRSHGFDLIREKPCRFSLDAGWPGTLDQLTTADGGQIWRNPMILN